MSLELKMNQLSIHMRKLKKYYSIGAEIARLEQNIQNAKTSEDRLKEELNRVENS